MKALFLISKSVKQFNIELLILLSVIGISFSSCEKVVELDLKDSEPKLVIEASVSDQNIQQIVRISKTIPFTQSNSFNSVSGATVMLTTPTGQKIPFNEVEKGIYQSQKFAGIPGNKYVLDVTVAGKVYTATSIMPLPVKLDSLSFKQISFFGKDNIFPIAYYIDPRAVANQYMYLLKVNGKAPEQILAEDRFTDGNKVTETLFTDKVELKEGDVLEVEMRGIDRNVFRYFFAIAQILGEGGPPVSPANPNSNFNNGALGVFGAYTTSTLTKIVKIN